MKLPGRAVGFSAIAALGIAGAGLGAWAEFGALNQGISREAPAAAIASTSPLASHAAVSAYRCPTAGSTQTRAPVA